MEKFDSVMIDIETLSTKANATVVSMGATAFNLHDAPDPSLYVNEDDTLTSRVLYEILDVKSQVNRHKDLETMKWWNRQGPEAKAVLTQEPRIDPKLAVEKFIEFAKQHKAKLVWCNGSTFDHIIVSNLCEEHGLKYPFLYYNCHDFRTVRYLAAMKVADQTFKQFVAHHAGYDAIKQTIYLQAMMQKMTFQ